MEGKGGWERNEMIRDGIQEGDKEGSFKEREERRIVIDRIDRDRQGG